MTAGDRHDLVCPGCQGALDFTAREIRCTGCGSAYQYRDGFPDLVVGGRFDDEDDPERSRGEELSNAWMAQAYLGPRLRALLAGIERPRVLSLGCGTGVDIDLLAESGFDIVGVDCGNRSAVWPRRTQRQRLYLANGKHLPFPAASFDAVYCGCVFPHIGVEGDSTTVRPDYLAQRLQVAREIARVLRPGGHVMVSSPNRLCPVDLFHRPRADWRIPRLNPPWNPFLLSAGDYESLFAQAGCGGARLLPAHGYWGFITARRTLRGRLLSWPVDRLLRLLSTGLLAPLRGSAINPWLVVTMQRSHVA
jgi:SAM-dependent methyltransferase